MEESALRRSTKISLIASPVFAALISAAVIARNGWRGAVEDVDSWHLILSLLWLLAGSFVAILLYVRMVMKWRGTVE